MALQKSIAQYHANSADEPVDERSGGNYSLGEDFENLKNAKIMMIDDESITLRVMQNLLENAGYCEFVLIDDSTKAMQKIIENRPDVILLDVNMPEVSGFDILQQLRADSELAHLPVIILTSSTDAETKFQALDLGASDFLSKPVDPSELALRVRNTLAAKAYRDQLSYYDMVTNLPNRRLFDDRLEWAIADAQIENSQFTLLHIAHTGYKRICDTFGAEVGDDVLKQIAERLVSSLRPSDIGSQFLNDKSTQIDLFYLSGAEFNILLGKMDGPANIPLIAQRILNAMTTPINASGTAIYLTPNVGVASFPQDAEDATSLVNCAMSACSQANSQNDHQVQFYSAEINQYSLDRLRIESDLRSAIESKSFKLLYQPKVDFKTGAIVGAEALIRWQRETGDLISPDIFIPIAEETGLILPIGEWVIREVFDQLVRWRGIGLKTKVAINLSGRQFFEAGLVKLLSELLTEYKLHPSCINLEITESFMIEGIDKAIDILDQFRALGIEVSIDDFGTGYSSLSYLKLLNVDELKIDRSFIQDIADSHEDRALVSGVTYLAHEFGLKVCAEGVENVEQLELLKGFDVDTYQGFYFDKPLPAEIFAKRFKSQR